MMKHWNRIRSDYIQSYHIGVLALNVLDGNLTDPPWEGFQFFENARPLPEGSLWHNVGYADSYLSFSDRLEVRNRIDTAIAKSRDAWYKTYGDNDDHEGAIKIWQRIFGSKFPNYG